MARPLNIRSRTMSSVHASPNASSAKWTGQSDLRWRCLIGWPRPPARACFSQAGLCRLNLRNASAIRGAVNGAGRAPPVVRGPHGEFALPNTRQKLPARVD